MNNLTFAVSTTELSASFVTEVTSPPENSLAAIMDDKKNFCLMATHFRGWAKVSASVPDDRSARLSNPSLISYQVTDELLRVSSRSFSRGRMRSFHWKVRWFPP